MGSKRNCKVMRDQRDGTRWRDEVRKCNGVDGGKGTRSEHNRTVIEEVMKQAKLADCATEDRGDREGEARMSTNDGGEFRWLCQKD